MTTYGDDAAVQFGVVAGTGPVVVERRGPARPERMSWASPMPFRPPAVSAAETFDPIYRAEQRRRRWARPLVVRAALGDSAVAAPVWLGAFASIGDFRRLAIGGAFAVVAAGGWCAVLWLVRAYDS